MNYKFNDNTLLHAVAFNPFKLESILQNGIISFNEASNSKLPFTRNTFGYNFDDYISMTRYMYVSFKDTTTSFYNYSLKGISLIDSDFNATCLDSCDTASRKSYFNLSSLFITKA